MRNSESAKQRKCETVKIRNDESVYLRRCETTNERNNESAEQRNSETTKVRKYENGACKVIFQTDHGREECWRKMDRV